MLEQLICYLNCIKEHAVQQCGHSVLHSFALSFVQKVYTHPLVVMENQK